MKYIKKFFMSLGIIVVAVCLIFGEQLMTYAQEDIVLFRWNPTPSDTAKPSAGHWTVDDSGWQYLNQDGKPLKEGWQTIDGKEYYFSKKGYMTTGWLKQNKKWYYLNPAGEKTSGWIVSDGKRYYLDETGVMQTGLQEINGKKYHFGKDGSLANGWVKENGTWYYLDEDNARHVGWLVDQDKYYYLDETGALKTGWFQDGNTWYYLQNDGAAANRWQTIDGKKYHFDKNGAMQTGWLQDGKTWYYLNDTGAMETGWLELNDGTYYLDKDGAMRTGWIINGGKAYFFAESGRLDESARKAKQGTPIALTFEGGPGKYTDRLLDCLEAQDAKATFFVLGSQVDFHKETVKRMRTLGCQVGNYTHDKKTLTDLSKEEIQNQIESTNQKVKAITGDIAWLVRPPGGSYDKAVAEAANQPLVLWSLDSKDSTEQDVPATVETVLNTIKGGDVVRMHDTSLASVEAAEILIPTLKSLGYNVVTVKELAASAGVSLKRQNVYESFRLEEQ